MRHFILALTVFSFSTLSAQTPTPPAPFEGIVTLEIWSIVDRIIHGETPAEERLLREAQYTLSGMIYGWDFVYTPEYPARGVQRWFEVEAIQGIRWGDPRLQLRAVTQESNTIYGQIDFELSDDDQRRLRAWSAMDSVRSVGLGSAPLRRGLPAKFTAIEEAIHQAIRDYLRSVTYNRPREVRGSVILQRPPEIRTDAGTYQAQVWVQLQIDEVVEYLSF